MVMGICCDRFEYQVADLTYSIKTVLALPCGQILI
jgi:hypothetical protein